MYFNNLNDNQEEIGFPEILNRNRKTQCQFQLKARMVYSFHHIFHHKCTTKQNLYHSFQLLRSERRDGFSEAFLKIKTILSFLQCKRLKVDTKTKMRHLQMKSRKEVKETSRLK